MPTILGANTESAAYEVSNSLRFNDDDSPKVSRSISSSGSARNATLSVWVKRANLGTRQQIYSNKTASSGFSGMNMSGHVYALFVIVLAAAEAAVALAIIINIFNNFRTINVDDVSELKQ